MVKAQANFHDSLSEGEIDKLLIYSLSGFHVIFTRYHRVYVLLLFLSSPPSMYFLPLVVHELCGSDGGRAGRQRRAPAPMGQPHG
jgi:hypothetical protein